MLYSDGLQQNKLIFKFIDIIPYHPLIFYSTDVSALFTFPGFPHIFYQISESCYIFVIYQNKYPTVLHIFKKRKKGFISISISLKLYAIRKGTSCTARF